MDLDLSDVVTLLPNLIRSGSVGLVWPRLRHRAEEYGAAGLALEQAYQSQRAHNCHSEREIARLAARLHGVGIHPVLIKGWAMARLYPAPAIRTTGDIDLVVQDGDYLRAIEALGRDDGDFAGAHLSFHGDCVGETRWAREGINASSGGSVDLHNFSHWDEVSDPTFFADAQRVPVGDGGEIDVPRVEDHLRALCLHFLRHAATRPSRLCDIALLLETRPDDFDWDRCLHGHRRREEQVTVALGLARELLGARVDGSLIEDRARHLPAWLIPQVIQHWEHPPAIPGPALPEVLANPRGIVHTFARRWPDAITATLRASAPFNNFPRLPVKMAAYTEQIGYYTAVTMMRQVTDLLQTRRKIHRSRRKSASA